MKIRLQEHDGVVVIAADEGIMQEHVPILRSRFEELLLEGKTRIVLDMSGATYLSSMGLAVIVDAKNRLSRVNGDIRMAGVNTLIMNLLTITNLIKKIRVFDSVDLALCSFGEDDPMQGV